MKKFVGHTIAALVVTGFAVTVLVMVGFAVAALLSITPSQSSSPLAASTTNESVTTGTILGTGSCIIHYTIDSHMNDEVTGIDCPPEGLPEEAVGKKTLKEQAEAIFPQYEEHIFRITTGDDEEISLPPIGY